MPPCNTMAITSRAFQIGILFRLQDRLKKGLLPKTVQDLFGHKAGSKMMKIMGLAVDFPSIQGIMVEARLQTFTPMWKTHQV